MIPSTLSNEWNALNKQCGEFSERSEEELLKVISSANEYCITVQGYIKQAEESAVISALRMGYALAVLKQKIKDRTWTEYMKEKLTAISTATIYRALKLAEHYPDPAKVPAGLTLMEAYRQCEAMKKNPSAEGPAAFGKPAAEFSMHLKRASKAFSGMGSEDAISRMTQDQIKDAVQKLGRLKKDLETTITRLAAKVIEEAQS